ncbi:MAG: RNA polymerase sigma factor [Crocinitomicaceae bacterium]|jgi:RNA polymerase sigma-70 factor (ECF subfamily)|nr:RNA polymerase sigma factor [Crocinitomicaceae bacterium]
MTAKEYNTSVDLFSDGIFRFALKHLRNENDARDVVQETFTKVWEKHEDVSYEKAKSYLFTAAYHQICDFAKKEKRMSGEYDEKMSGQVQMENFDVRSIIDKALAQLPEIQRSVVLLRDYEGYNYQEIGEICSLTEAQVKVYIFRARKALKEMLKEIELIV